MRKGRSSGYLPQSSAAVSFKPDIRLECVSWCQSCHGKERGAGRQIHCATWTPVYDSEPGLGSPETLIPRDDESRFLLQEIIFAHSPYEGVFHNRPSLQGNLLCRSDWLRLRGIAKTECVILPVREPAAFLPCSVREHLRAGRRTSARRSLLAPVLLDEFSWQSGPVPWSGSLGRADSSFSGRTDNIYDSDLDRWKLRREAEAEWSQSSDVSLCVSRVRAPAASACEYGDSGAPGKESTWRRAKHPKSDLSRHRLISKSVNSLPDRSIQAQNSAGAEPSCRRQPNRGKSTLRKGAAARGACSCGPLSGPPAWPNAT